MGGLPAALAIDSVTLDEAVARIGLAVERGERGFVVTPNVDHVVRYRRDLAFRAAYDRATLKLPDGMPIVWAWRLLGRPLKARVTGADLLPAVCAYAASAGRSVFLMGGRAGVAPAAARRLSERFPGLRVAGVWTPADPFDVDGPDAAAAAGAIERARPDLLFVGVGSPKQEFWVVRHWERLGATVAICCGAAIDYAAGTLQRAPGWIQRSGLEWLWRLAREPRRLWRRYLVDDAAFVGIVLTEWWRLRFRMSR
jgi:N-acetylglucosaminyldiphosphoundecaprenol N-acetyl-beta-D-mannosaminyltransferase